MQKQNRNSQVHINGESGKTDFIIDPLLPIGKENAITILPANQRIAAVVKNNR